jgi:hypothetical protein
VYSLLETHLLMRQREAEPDAILTNAGKR